MKQKPLQLQLKWHKKKKSLTFTWLHVNAMVKSKLCLATVNGLLGENKKKGFLADIYQSRNLRHVASKKQTLALLDNKDIEHEQSFP